MTPYIVFIYFKFCQFNYVVNANSYHEAIQKGKAHAIKDYGEEVFNRRITRIACREA